MRLAALCICLAAPAAAQDLHDCIMDPSLVIEVGAAVDGLMDEAFVTRGDDVVKGQLIATLDGRVQQAVLTYAREVAESGATVEIAENRLALAKSETSRAETLRQGNLIAESVVETLRSQVSEAELQLQQAHIDQRLAVLEQARVEAQLDQRQILSPIDGIVITRMMSPGEYVYSQTPVAQLAQTDPIHIEVFLPTEIYRSLSAGDVGMIYPADPIGGEYTAQIIAIDRVFDAASDTFGVRLALANPDGALPTGLDCEVKFVTQ